MVKLKSALRIEHGRCARVADTVARLEAALGRVCGYTYTEFQASPSLYWGACNVDGLGFAPMGKGGSSQECKASTLAETAEWLALRRRRQLPGYVSAHQSELQHALPLEALIAHVADVTPELLDRIKATGPAQHWVDGYSLLEERTRPVPLETINGISGTNGVAAGNCLEEAVVQGVYEVLERRAVITAMRNRLVLPTIDVTTIEDPFIRAQLDELEQHGTQVTVKDLSFGGALPAIGVYCVTPGVPATLQAHHLFKGAASYDRCAALSSCLTEYAQVCHLGQRERETLPSYERLLCEGPQADNFLPLFWFGYLPYREMDFITQGEVVPFEPGAMAGDCLEDIERLKTFCETLGLDLLVVDLTDPAVGFPVVQVVIPGYSDILPYHPASSPVLLEGWTRDLRLGDYEEGGRRKACSAAELFPDW